MKADPELKKFKIMLAEHAQRKLNNEDERELALAEQAAQKERRQREAETKVLPTQTPAVR